MKKTGFDQNNVLYAVLNAADCPLKTAITGSIYKENRPITAALPATEDVVINSLAITFDAVQLGVSMVNIYVADVRTDEQNRVPDHARLNLLTGLAVAALSDLSLPGVSLWPQAQGLEQETDLRQHYASIRVEFRHFTY